MQKDKFTHPYTLRVIDTIGAGLRAMRLPIANFKEETLFRAASKQTGLSDFGDAYFREGLRCLLDSAEQDAKLHFLGRMVFYNWILLQLTNRLLLVETMKRRPEIFEHPLLHPIVIIGLPRSGTTLLHRMLALDPAHRGVPVWEVNRPIPPIGGSPDRRRQTAEQEIKLRSKFTANIDHKHYSGLDDSEECLFMLGLTFVNTSFWLFADVYGYIDWYMKQNLFEKKYQDYLLLLQVLQSANPVRRLVMKAPEHSPKVDVLLRIIPSALIIQTHRDPVAVVPSLNSLYYSIHISLADQVDIKRLAKTNLHLLKWETECNRAARMTCAGQILDIQYEQIAADPVDTVRDVYRHFQLDWPNEFERSLQEYIEKNPKDKHGSHHYSPDDFGQTSQEIVEKFKEYNEEFGYARGAEG